MKICSLPLKAMIMVLLASTLRAAEPDFTVKVWPTTAPGETGQVGEERVRLSVPPAKPQKEIFNVTVPTLEFFRPEKSIDTGAALLILPGGGFGVLKMDYEGEDFAVWLQKIGVTGIVLKYRVPQRTGGPRYLAALQDAQRAMSVVRSRAGEWGIDPNRIGLSGFSAGSVVGAVAQTAYDKRRYDAKDETDKVSCRPDFSVLIYPGSIVTDGKLIEDVHVTKDSPQTFIAVAHSDQVQNSVQMYMALKQAGVSAEMHIYSDGEHGFGMFASDEPHGTWTARLHDWMKQRGLLKRASD